MTHLHPWVNYFTLLSYNECRLLEGARLTALKSTEQVLQRHQQSQFSSHTSIFLNHCGLTIRQLQLYSESRCNLPSLRIFCSFPIQKFPNDMAFFFLSSYECWNTASVWHLLDEMTSNCSAALWTEWAVRLASCSRDSPPNCHGEPLLWTVCILTTCTQPHCR